jgi:hypothetical protein
MTDSFSSPLEFEVLKFCGVTPSLLETIGRDNETTRPSSVFGTKVVSKLKSTIAVVMPNGDDAARRDLFVRFALLLALLTNVEGNFAAPGQASQAPALNHALPTRIANKPIPLPRYKSPANVTGATPSSNNLAKGVLAPNRAAAKSAERAYFCSLNSIIWH